MEFGFTQAMGFLISALISFNIYFIKQLAVKIEQSANDVRDFKKDIQYLNEKIGALADLNARVLKIEKTTAVLQFMMAKGISHGESEKIVNDLERD